MAPMSPIAAVRASIVQCDDSARRMAALAERQRIQAWRVRVGSNLSLDVRRAKSLTDGCSNLAGIRSCLLRAIKISQNETVKAGLMTALLWLTGEKV